jgi:hypothetical protein
MLKRLFRKRATMFDTISENPKETNFIVEVHLLR